MQEMPNVDIAIRDVPRAWIDEVSAAVASVGPDTAVVVLPEFFERGIAVFPDYLTPMVKSLRAEGVTATFLDGEQGRTFRSRFSADASAVCVGVILNVLSNGIYDAIKVTFQFLRLRLAESQDATRVSTTTLRIAIPRNSDGTGLMWQEIVGPTDKVLAYGETTLERHLSAGDHQPSSASSD